MLSIILLSIIVIMTIVIVGTPVSIIAYLLLSLGRRIAGNTGMKAATVVLVLIAAIPLFWAIKQYWRLWMAGISLRPQYGDHYLGYAISAGFLCVPILVVALLRRRWRRHLPTPS